MGLKSFRVQDLKFQRKKVFYHSLLLKTTTTTKHFIVSIIKKSSDFWSKLIVQNLSRFPNNGVALDCIVHVNKKYLEWVTNPLCADLPDTTVKRLRWTFPPKINSCAFRAETLGCNCFKGWCLRAAIRTIKKRTGRKQCFSTILRSVSAGIPLSYLTHCTWPEASPKVIAITFSLSTTISDT